MSEGILLSVRDWLFVASGEESYFDEDDQWVWRFLVSGYFRRHRWFVGSPIGEDKKFD